MNFTDGIKLHEGTEGRENNFHFLRFMAASLVILSHSFPLTGLAFEPFNWLTGYETFGWIAVSIFFVISGFLVTKSWFSSPNVTVYFKKRFLRIMPALVVSVLFCMFIVGPLATSKTLGAYFSDPSTYRFLYNVLLYPISFYFPLPGVFVSNPLSGAVNGSLWTLPLEFTMYSIVAILGFVGMLGRRNVLVFFTLGLMAIYFQLMIKPEYYKTFLILYMRGDQFFQYAPFFFLGALFFLYRNIVILSGQVSLFLVVLFVAFFKTAYVGLISYFVIPYLVLYIAYADMPFIRNFAKHGDFSYGLYVYAFPVQQLIIFYHGNRITPLNLFLMSYVVILSVAVLSWRFVENPMLKLKANSLNSLLRRI